MRLSRTSRGVIVAALASGSLTMATPAAASGASITVTTTADTRDANPGDGVCADLSGACSLRAAIDEANAEPSMTTISLDGAARYVLSLGGSGDDANQTGDLDIWSEVQIDGNGATIEGSGDRIVDVAVPGKVVLRNLGFTGGRAPAENGDQSGGAIRNAGVLRIAGSALTGNAATSAADAGGGAVFNDGGTLVVQNSRISGNRADGERGSGGGVRSVGGQVTFETTSVRDNVAALGGGGIDAVDTTLSITMGRVDRNRLGDAAGNGGGVRVAGGSAQIVNAYVRNNLAPGSGGGVWTDSPLRVEQSRIDTNEAQGDADTQGGGGVFNLGGELDITSTPMYGNRATGDLGSGGAVASVGGRVRLTYSTLSSNTANRAGGAIELNGADLVLDHAKGSGNDAGAAPGAGGFLHVTGPAVVDITNGSFRRNTASEGGGLWNASEATMTVTNSVIAGNVADGDAADQGGGGILNDGGTLTVVASELTNNHASGIAGGGGAIANLGGSLALRDSLLGENTASRAGGGVESTATATIERTEIRNNRADDNVGLGGGIHTTGALRLDGGSLFANTAADGGGLWNGAGPTTIDWTVIRSNAATGDAPARGGGGVFNSGGTLSIRNAVIDGNAARGEFGSGGGVRNLAGALEIENSIIESNRSRQAGGGVATDEGTVSVIESIVRTNRSAQAPGNGGGLHMTGAADVFVDLSTIVDNRAANEGGGVWKSATSTLELKRTTVEDNKARVGSNVFTSPV